MTATTTSSTAGSSASTADRARAGPAPVGMDQASEMIWSSRSPLTAPATDSIEPSVLTMANAGWNATSKRLKTMPGSSLICGNVSPCLSMKPWNESSSPVHATPTKLTESPNFAAASSTEGASRLHVLQVGAQNQNTVGLPANVLASSSPPPTSGALNWRAAGAAARAASPSAASLAGAPAVDSPAASVAAGTASLSVAESVADPPLQAANSRLPAAKAPSARVDLIPQH